MGEGTSAAWVKAPKPTRSGSQKLRRNRLIEIPPEAENALFDVATEIGARPVLLLLTKYFLRPEQLVGCKLADDGLSVDGFTQPIPIDDDDRDEIVSWLSKARRVHSAEALRNLIGDLRKKTVKRLEGSEESAERSSDWAGLLDVGVVALRRLAAERHAEACGFAEELYRDLLHEETADPYEVLRHLSRPARQILARAAHGVLEEILAVRARQDADK